MATLPGTPFTAQGYRDSVWILTMGEPHQTVVDGAPPGPNGRVYGCEETGKPIRVPREAARFLIEHCGYSGVVPVRETDRPDGTGTDLDIESAKADSLAKFAEGDENRWQQYMGYVMWKLEKKELVPPPPDGIKRLMARRGYQLKDYGIDVMGQAGQLGGNAELSAAKAQIADLTAKLTTLTDLLTSQASRTAELEAKLNDALGEPAAPDKKKRT